MFATNSVAAIYDTHEQAEQAVTQITSVRLRDSE